MESIANIVLSRQTALDRRMAAISHNMANMNTTAYRREDLQFEEVLEDPQPRTIGYKGEAEDLSFVQDIYSFYDLESGPLEVTNNPFDVGINGDGYFTIQTEDGVRYTRDGGFQLDADNRLVTKEGRPVLDDNGNEIDIPETAGPISIARDGTISSDQEQIAQLGVVTFENDQALNKRPDSLYEAAGQQPQPLDAPEIHQGMLEGSNVNGIVEMTTMMKVVKSYQSAQRMIDEDNDRQLRAIRSLVSSQ
jgi:flagellar basal-body rod protein FlgF